MARCSLASGAHTRSCKALKIGLFMNLAQEQNIDSPTDVNLALEIRDGGKKYLRQFRFNLEGSVTLHIYFDAVFALIGPTGSTLSSPIWSDGMFRVYFPGDYTVCSQCVLEADLPRKPWKPAPLSRQPSVAPTPSSRDEILDPSMDAGLIYPDAMILGPSTTDLLDSPPPSRGRSATPKKEPLKRERSFCRPAPAAKANNSEPLLA